MDPLHLLCELGLSRYEAQAYLTLLEQQPMTAYELAKQSGIPSSKVYEVVAKLTDKQLCQALASEQTRKKQYIAMEAQQLVHAKQRHTKTTGAALLNALAKRQQQKEDNHIWSISSADEVFSRSEQIIQHCQQTLLLSLWPDQLKPLFDDLKKAQRRGVKIALVHFGEPEQTVGITYHHPVEQSLYLEKGGMCFNLVADSQQMLIATFLADGEVEGAYSQNQAFVNVTEDYIRHDVYITKTTNLLQQQMQQHFGADYQKLRDVFNPLGALE